jgi:hypothetical protein
MSLEPIPLSRRRTLDAIEDAHNRALDLLDDPLVRPLDAIEWLSAHLSAASWTPSTPGRYRHRTRCGSRRGGAAGASTSPVARPRAPTSATS